MSGVVADISGDIAFDCTIQDMNAYSAQIGFSHKSPLGAQVYLLDTGNRIAYLANVAWNKSQRAGLLFGRGHPIGAALPPKLKFLWRLLLQAKLREADRIVANGIPVELAFRSVGLAKAHLAQMAQHAGTDKKFERLILHAREVMNRAPIPAGHIDRRTHLISRRMSRRRKPAV